MLFRSVSQTILWRVFSLPAAGNAGGLLFLTFTYIKTGAMLALLSSVLIPLLVTFLVFLMVVYAEGMYVNIPLTVGQSGIDRKSVV